MDPESGGRTSERDHPPPLNLPCSGTSGTTHLVPSSSHPTNQKPSALKASDGSLSHTEEFSQLPSKPKSPQSTSHQSEPTKEEEPPLNGLHWLAPLPQAASRNLGLSRVADWPPTVSWNSEVWASELSLVGNRRSTANGRCLKWRAENVSHQVETYLGESARPVKVTLLKTSF
ncbi:hypothetical protein JRQ81_005763 [Phrynocephalus forsythii]|uniref:Uncharacterized protein n=1 Tax=Phrynocephalus forsythii TaxID=171643 RepID=A0A9Q0XIT8_9SAUR|nr:hypothetical protein JRQ81_005763 [Phrynocephalus forsythii]